MEHEQEAQQNDKELAWTPERKKKAWEELFPHRSKDGQAPNLEEEEVRKATVKSAKTKEHENPTDIVDGISRDLNEQRKIQIQVGERVLNFLVPQEDLGKSTKDEKNETDEKDQREELKKIGRPKKNKTEKVQIVSMKLSPLYLQFFKNIEFDVPKAKGIGGKVRYLVDSYLKFKHREKEQLQILQRSLSTVQIKLEQYSKIFKRKDMVQETATILNEMERSMEHTKLLMRILKFDFQELQVLLSSKEASILNFALTWKRPDLELSEQNHQNPRE